MVVTSLFHCLSVSPLLLPNVFETFGIVGVVVGTKIYVHTRTHSPHTRVTHTLSKKGLRHQGHCGAFWGALGFEGQWTEDRYSFDNSYFTEMVGKVYVPTTVEATGQPQYEVTTTALRSSNEGGTSTIMLESDLALLQP
jgi:catalase (peroxidase I)